MDLPVARAGTTLILAAALLRRRSLDALLTVDETASSLGVDVEGLRREVFLASALGTAALVSLAGVIGFVGLMVPHLARAFVGVRHGPLILTAAVGGAILMLAGDLASRLLLAPQELPIGIVTAAVGGGFVLLLTLRHGPGATS